MTASNYESATLKCQTQGFLHRTQDNMGLMCKWHWQSRHKTSLLEHDSYFAPTSTLFKALLNKASVSSVPAQPCEWCVIDTPLCCLSKESFCSLCNYRGTSQLYLPLKHTHSLLTPVRGLRLGFTGLMATSSASLQFPMRLPFQTRFGNVLPALFLLFQQAFRRFLSHLVKCLTFWFNQHPWLPVKLDHYQKCGRYGVSLTCQRPTRLLIYLSHSSSHGDTL